MTTKLTQVDEERLVYLRQQVDDLEQIRFLQASSTASTNLMAAREELRLFVEGKRRQGYTI